MPINTENIEDEYELQLPFGLPPVLPNVEKQLRDYIICPERLPIHDFRQSQLFWPRIADPSSLYNVDLCPPSTTLKVERDATTGEVLRYVEVATAAGALTARNSNSLQRAPAPPDESVKGSASNFPFWPGGFPEPDLDTKDIDLKSELLSIAPGFERGFDFNKIVIEEKTVTGESQSKVEASASTSNVIDLAAILRQEGDLLGTWNDVDTSKSKLKSAQVDISSEFLHQVDDVLTLEEEHKVPVLKITKSGVITSKTSTEWAEIIDVAAPVTDFEQKVPDMAHKYPFELDPFQKQAILHLEKHEHVFVAAHTSAGKTVVAEYAIALSRKNMTRAIYTSPIKALSNQKYRDFQQTFGDVGLITGDFQLNQTASCLVMTTEILKSMLYGGSDVIRDLQYAIFDEVHYVNDADRGHVWEEVLILLPPHVIIVMLSATVPNTLEFADWVGRTKQKKVFVMSTPKRPVPLEHSLYLGFNADVNKRQFLVLDSDGHFRANALKDATESRLKKEKTNATFIGRGQDRGGGRGGRGGERGGRGGHPAPSRSVRSGPVTQAQEETIWVSLLRDLQKKEKLPTVAFTFSRKRCDTNADALKSVDLLTESQKSHVHKFFKRSLQRLKEEDQILPQVVRMQMLLENGIGVHHSGILPILKEIVELLFQEGFVKFLFATETFAMGVNMPARTVVFDSTRKFDGIEVRSLVPAEYIQMAGRAGRRGLDPTGTVLILCKNDLPTESDLRSMMLGQPTVLSSQFRLTYSMILSLLRVETITVEGMMKQSFRELNHKLRADKLKTSLAEVTEKLKSIEAPTGALTKQLNIYYIAANDWIQEWNSVSMELVKQAGPSKELIPGHVVMLTQKDHLNKLGIVLKSELQRHGTLAFKVLVLTDSQDTDTKEEHTNKWYQMLGLARGTKHQAPSEGSGHTILNVSPSDLWFVVSNLNIKVEADKVIGDWEKRQNPRFRDDPPWAACMHAVQELSRVSQASDLKLRPVLLSNDWEVNISDMNLRQKAERVLRLRTQVESLLDVTNIANFEHEFASVFKYQELTRQQKDYHYMLSNASMSMFPEYEGKVEVLRRMGYINRDNAVQLKGRVACEMGQHELIITEMVLAGMLSSLQPAEVAALLSGLVFQNKKNKDDSDEDKHPLTPGLKKGMEEIFGLAERLRIAQKDCNVEQVSAEDYEALLNFELAGVIYEWARGKPFAQIMELTEVQEGIIVRCIQQLGELLRDVKDAARIIGDPQLHAKMEEASNLIKRDIVFAASLYTQ